LCKSCPSSSSYEHNYMPMKFKAQGVLCQMQSKERMEPTFTQFREPRILVFGQHSCNQCTAKSKRSGARCLAPAVKGKSVCRMHGGKSTGPRTEEGRNLSISAKLVHGAATRKIRLAHKIAMMGLRALEKNAQKNGIPWGKKIQGRKPC
jgi:hypothetical protein